MDPAACAETTVEMYSNVNAKLTARQLGSLDPVIKAQILSEAMKLYMTHIIKESRSVVPSSKEKQSDEPPTPKQREFIKDLGGNPDLPETKQEASDYISKLKG
jgi:hypothetical protein